MRALVVNPPAPGIHLADLPEPVRGPGEVKVRIVECGVCGTDRDIVLGKYGRSPAGHDALILGHENLGVVVESGPETPGFDPGDLVVATVRRGCGQCRFCFTNRSDFCESGLFTERGIKGRDGYFCEVYTERPEYLVKVPGGLRSRAVLLEPMSVVEKALAEGRSILTRFEPTPGYPLGRPYRALVTGTGAIGILASLLLAADGFTVTAVDLHDDTTPAARLLAAQGVAHVNLRGGIALLGDARFDLIVDATGVADLELHLVDYLRPNGVLVLTGIPAADAPPITVPAGRLLRDLVLENQAVVGSVNANRSYFELGRDHLVQHADRWGPEFDRLIFDRTPLDGYGPVLEQKGSSIKHVLTFPPAG